MNNVRRLSLGLLALLALAQAAAALTIADARALPLGTVVTLEGSVTVDSGIFATSTFDQGFGIEDNTAGIYVATPDNAIVSSYQKVRVTGVLADDGVGQLVVRPTSLSDITRLPGSRRIHPESEATGDIGEGTEGSLVKVEGAVTRIINDIPYGYKVYIDDGSGETQVFIAASTGVNPYRIPYIAVGAEIEVVGFSSQFLAEYEVLPRTYSDIRRVH